MTPAGMIWSYSLMGLIMIGYGKYDGAPHTCLPSQEKYGAASARPYSNHKLRSFSELQTDYQNNPAGIRES